ncbi:hypothetical protein N0B31_19340 [Salinirubellus salinus]|uniref:DUF7982 domain-containing protein n=1 Tax=Salinirubellus salinus TaxID=1364945 RepID=A0A9E7UAP2_9EURY|nr:hypothetical protein [Salinirubellus salinus]UWM54257.1 hypothetical protein N0B31_19340 [Salinirubellus salinus]
MSGNDTETDPVDERATAATQLLAGEAVKTSGPDTERSRRRGQRRERESGRTVAGQDRRSVGWAVAFAVLGLAAAAVSAAGLVAPETQGIVAALGGAGVFLSLLTLALSPTTHDGRETALFERVAGNYERAAADLGLATAHYYVPTGGEPPVRLFRPREADAPVPSVDKLSATFVGRRDAGGLLGLALDPSGLALLDEVDADLPDEPLTLAGELCGAAVDRMEVAEIAQPNVDVDTGRATVAFRGTAYGSIERFDHPVRSFVGVGLALGLDRPVRTEVVETPDGEFRIRYTWQTR